MALVFGAARSDRCDIGSAAALDDMTTGTAWLWTRITTLTTPRCFFGKNAQLACNIANPSALNIRLIRATSGTNIIYTTSDNPLATNQWLFIAVAFDFNASSGRAKIYTGTLTALATERTYGTAQDGSGSLQSDAAAPFHWGNNGVAPTPALALPGSIARCGLANRVLTLEEIRQLQRGPRPISGLLGAWELGFDGTGTQIDRGGGGFNGTVTGATLGDHVPLRRWRRGGVPTHYKTSTTYQVTLAGGLTPSGAIIRQAGKAVAGGTTPSGSLVPIKAVVRAFAATVAPTGALARLTARRLAGAMTPAGSLGTLKVSIVVLVGALAPAGSVVRQARKSLAGSAAPAGVLVRQVTKGITGALSPAAALARAVVKRFAGGISPSGALGTLKVVIVALAGALAPAGAVVRQARVALGGALAPVGVAVRQARKTVSGLLAPAGILTRRTTKLLSGALSPLGALIATAVVGGGSLLLRLVAGIRIAPRVRADTDVTPRSRADVDIGPLE